jgi:protocatechuate 3,4-dioxygenase, beta subunit
VTTAKSESTLANGCANAGATGTTQHGVNKPPSRRSVMRVATAAAACVAMPSLAQRTLPGMTEGPFYPPTRWRSKDADWDADLSRVRNAGQVLVARGEHLGLDVRVVDQNGKPLDKVVFEIWQCDAAAFYRHPSVNDDDNRRDKGFQGFGAAATDATGQVRFRTIKPVPYPGRTPHIHVKLRHASFSEVTSQLFLANEPGNARDFIWRSLSEPRQLAVDMVLLPSQEDGLSWRAQHTVVVDV